MNTTQIQQDVVKYGWKCEKENSKYYLVNRLGKRVAEVKLLPKDKYLIFDMGGFRLLSGNKSVSLAAEQVAAKYFYAKLI